MTRRTFLKWLIGAGSSACLVSGYPVFIERYLTQFNRYRIPVPNLPAAFQGLRIAQVSDVHYGRLMPRWFVNYLLERVNRAGADVIVCTGDYIYGQGAAQIEVVWPMLCELRAPLGVYSVLGNHDHWGSTERSLYWLERSGQNLRGKALALEKDGERLWLAGIGDFWEDPFPVDSVLSQIPERECRIVLAHNPDSADTPFSGRIDLMLSGHTHGGQVRIPFGGAPVLPVKNKTYSSGLKMSTKQQRVFISRGIGWAIYPVRFNCYPEIPILELIRG